jgi:cobalt/nickel transport system permease protein
MGNHLLNVYQSTNSWLHNVSAGYKMLGALFIIVMTVTQHPGNWLAIGLIILLISAITFSARLNWQPLLHRLLMLEILALGIALLPLLQGNGIELFLYSLTRISICLFTMIVLSSTTRFADILKVLLDLRIPPLLITTLALMYRYLFLLQDEMHTLNRARRSRTFSENKSLIWQVNANLLAQLFIRATERAERIYGAMKARGWKG